MAREDYRKETGFKWILNNVWKNGHHIRIENNRRSAHENEQPTKPKLQIWARMMILVEALEVIFFKSDPGDI